MNDLLKTYSWSKPPGYRISLIFKQGGVEEYFNWSEKVSSEEKEGNNWQECKK